MNCDGRRRGVLRDILTFHAIAAGLIFGALMFLMGAGFCLVLPIGFLTAPGDFWLSIANAFAAFLIGFLVAGVSWCGMCQSMRRLLAILKVEWFEAPSPNGK